MKKKPVFRFMAMSKLIGVIIFLLLIFTVLYALYEMHISQDYNSLSQLLISVFGLAGIYAGFYLTMAKVEHIEEEKTRREIEIANLQKKLRVSNETLLEEKKQEIEIYRQKINDLLDETTNNMM